MNIHLSNISNYKKALITPHEPNNFVIADCFKHGMTDDEIRKGIIVYRDFLHAFFDMISKNTDKIDEVRGKKYDTYGTKGDKGTSSVKEHFPVFFDMAMILLSLGFHGSIETKPEMRLSVCGDDLSIAVCPITEKYQSFIKMKNERRVELFGLLMDLGLRFIGADFTNSI